MLTLDLNVKTEKEVTFFRICEKKGRFHVYKISHWLFGLKRHRKMAEARTQAAAFKLIHVLAASPITNMEIKVGGETGFTQLPAYSKAINQ